MNKPSKAAGAEQSIADEYREYTHIVSHDLSAPVRAMVEFSKILSAEHSSQLNEEGQEYLQIILDSGTKLQAMMRGLLDFSRVETSEHKIEVIDVNVLVADVTANIKVLPEFAGMPIDIRVSDLPELNASPALLNQLFSCLIDNAIRYHRPDISPVITIDVHDDGAYWHFSVADNGKGVAENMQARIFKVLSRLHADEEYPGIGMGLAIAKKITNTYGGHIWCESDLQHGSTFHFTLAKERVAV